MNKKILFIAPSLCIGGMERVLVNYANEFSKKGYEITIKLYNSQIDLVKYLDPKIILQVIPNKSFPILSKLPLIKNYININDWILYFSPKALYKYYVEKKYDIEIAFFRGLSVKIVSGSTNKKSKKIAWVHSDFLKCKGITSSFRNINKTKQAYKKFDSIICVSNSVAKSFSMKMGISKNVHTIYNILPIKEIIKNSKVKINFTFDSKFTMIAIGHLVKHKGFDRLIKVILKLNKEKIKCSLIILGDGPEERSLSSFIKKNNLFNVKLLGIKENPYPYIQKSKLLVCSSLYEGYNLTIAEALILGIPVLSTDCSGPNEILNYGQYGLIVKNNTISLYDGIKKLLLDEEIYTYYKNQAQKRLQFFDKNKSIKQIEKLF